VISPSNNS